MIQIQQDMPNAEGLEVILNKKSEAEFNIDVDAVRSDIEELNEKVKNPINKMDKRNTLEVIRYLRKLLDKTEDGILELAWRVDEDVLRSYPLDLKYIPEYNIDMTDYIKLENDRLIRVQYTDIFNAMTLEMMYRDLGETMQSMERYLSDVGITGIYPVSRLTGENDPNLYLLSKVLRVGDSPYWSSDIKTLFEYFGKKGFKSDYYNDCMEYSFMHALTIITANILNKLTSSSIEYNLCSVSTSGIYFTVEDKHADKLSKLLNESVVIRAFGRRFEVQPSITIF